MEFHVYVHFDHPEGHTRLDRILLDVEQIKQIVQTITDQGDQIMSAISDFAAKQTQFNTDTDTAITALQASVTGVTGDIANLNAQIAALQASPGAITPADQALLDGLTTAGGALKDKMTAMSTALAALDALTPPVVPVVPPVV